MPPVAQYVLGAIALIVAGVVLYFVSRFVLEIVRNPMLISISFNSLLQHKRRTSILGAAVAIVACGLVLATGTLVGIRSTLLTSATTLMSGHVNVSGFYKATASQSAPVVTGYKRVAEVVKRDTPELDFIVQRGRGWAKLVSDTGSMQVGIGGIDIENEPGFKNVVVVLSGKIEDLARPDGILIFEEQAEKLGAKVGDRMTIAAPTPRGTNNTLDVTVIAIAQSIGMLSGWNTYINDQGLRKLYQLNEETTGALQLYLKDINDVKKVQERLRNQLATAGYGVLDNDPRPFWMKFQGVNSEAWTGQKLDITNWEDETAFVQWIVKGLTGFSIAILAILIVIIAAGIMNVVWISIRERTREIGTLRAVGMQRSSILTMFVLEGFLLGLIGSVSGVVVGLLLSYGLDAAHIFLPKETRIIFMSEHLVITPSLGWVMFGIFFITVTITAISIIPSLIAARMKPISAMAHVG